jgi:hypothetical protein
LIGRTNRRSRIPPRSALAILADRRATDQAALDRIEAAWHESNRRAADAWKSDTRRAADAEIAAAPPLAQDERESAPEAGAS